MIRGHRIAVVIPAFNEADKIARTIRSVPGFVDHVLVVDDASGDATARIAMRSARRGLEVLTHPRNRGVGAAIATGYRRALALGADATAVMAGDAQMDPADLPQLLAPILSGEADYTKGNRFAWSDCWRQMPLSRYLGNVVLSVLTKFACGYRRLFDSQCGYTVASRVALLAIHPNTMFARYGYPNDLLARLARAGARVVDVPVRPVYGPEWRSGIRIWTVVYPISFLLLRALCLRIFVGATGRFVKRRSNTIQGIRRGIRQASSSV
ncbi:MAG: glycosyltransferase family 2 protein [Deltaproteobacteria bacterium]|nr:glycosyltransferase family 2 protein [Deltaproteobacteria bacterium]